jgi:hypothetical protein
MRERKPKVFPSPPVGKVAILSTARFDAGNIQLRRSYKILKQLGRLEMRVRESKLSMRMPSALSLGVNAWDGAHNGDRRETPLLANQRDTPLHCRYAVFYGRVNLFSQLGLHTSPHYLVIASSRAPDCLPMMLLHLADIHFREPDCTHLDTDPDHSYRTHVIHHVRAQVEKFGTIDAILVGGGIAIKADPREYSVAKIGSAALPM